MLYQRLAALSKALLAGIILFYIISCFTPMRLEYDSMRYFGIKDCLQYGCPPDSPAANDFLPYGYPFFLVTLSRLGILHSFTIVCIHLAFLFSSLYFVRKIFGSAIRPVPFFILVLMNWMVIKLVAYPLSEMQYLFFSMASLYSFHLHTRNRKIVFLLAAFVFAVLAFMTRTIGVILLPALLTGLVWEYRNELISNVRRNRIKIILAGGILLILVTVLLLYWKPTGFDHYTGVWSGQKEKDYFPGEVKQTYDRADVNTWHFEEWGEMAINIPIGKIKPHLPTGIAEWLFIGAGSLLLIVIFIDIWYRRRKLIPAIVPVYLVLYSIVIFVWPYHDPRMWLPVVPLIAGIAVQAPMKQKLIKIIGASWLGIYVLTGAAAMGYSIYTQFNKEALARNQANGIFRNEYEIHFFGKPLSDTAQHIDTAVLQVLEKYD